MSQIIAIAGKGGTGKTTICAMLVKILKERKTGSILAVDADPNSNLAENLGVKPEQTIGGILDAVSNPEKSIPPGMPKDRFIELEVQKAVEEAGDFDVLTMGRPEGPGCYCYVNNVLRASMDKLIKDYDFVIIDNEAGLEHLSRRTTRYADSLLIISNPTPVGLKSAERILAITKELGIKTRRNLLLINTFNQDIKEERIRHLDLEYLGSIPLDPEITKISLAGGSFCDLNDSAISLAALRKIGDKIWG